MVNHNKNSLLGQRAELIIYGSICERRPPITCVRFEGTFVKRILVDFSLVPKQKHKKYIWWCWLLRCNEQCEEAFKTFLWIMSISVGENLERELNKVEGILVQPTGISAEDEYIRRGLVAPIMVRGRPDIIEQLLVKTPLRVWAYAVRELHPLLSSDEWMVYEALDQRYDGLVHEIEYCRFGVGILRLLSHQS